MTFKAEIQDLTRRIEVGKHVIEENRRYIRFMVDQGMNSADKLRELAQLERTHRSQEELLDLTRVLAAMGHDPRKG